MKIIAVNEALRAVKPKLEGILESLSYSASSITDISIQWNNVALIDWQEKYVTSKFWAEVKNYADAGGNKPFGELAEFALHLLVLPFSNAEVERVFSQMNLVKCKIRNRMQNKMLNAIISIRAHMLREKKCCHELDVPISVLNQIGNTSLYQSNNAENIADSDIDKIIEVVNMLD